MAQVTLEETEEEPNASRPDRRSSHHVTGLSNRRGKTKVTGTGTYRTTLPYDDLRVDLIEVDGASTLRLAGELDLGTSGQLADALTVIRSAPDAAVTVDVCGLTFLDAQGLGLLIEAHNRLLNDGNWGLAVRGASGIVRRIFELTNTSYLLDDARSDRIFQTAQPESSSPKFQFELARRKAHLSVTDVYLDYLALGGTADLAGLRARLCGDTEALDSHQGDILSQALNERLIESEPWGSSPSNTPSPWAERSHIP